MPEHPESGAPILVRLVLNGRETEIPVPRANDTLLYVLREHLGLKGTRFGCGEEACGACMVLLDGQPVPSCTALAAELGGKRLETVESLPRGPGSLIAAFIAEQAGQCGYCLSGILISATALLRRQPAPTRAEIAVGLDRHLCRCGAHNRIIRAVARAASGK